MAELPADSEPVMELLRSILVLYLSAVSSISRATDMLLQETEDAPSGEIALISDSIPTGRQCDLAAGV